ncbi:Rho GTPase activation protein [Meira miltonrushii]|uniref:Rho GTPase activation protein n=1 Tax=Meira miltonrushii TaxID=1280837 RepID=A0A316VB53_9BASI|nr:Rho GTPase activation protein [Meira miltonrushii]PWN32785.1 Rho GTPase activation protein [Meira miltonrushii]
MSFFAPWKAIGDAPTDPSSSSNQQSSSGPITAPGGWSSLLTWRPQRQGPTISASSSNEMFIDADTSQMNAFNDRYYTTRSPSSKTTKAKYNYDIGENDEGYENENEIAAYTARTRQKGGGGVTKLRAPIPFELDRTVVSRSKARSGTVSSTASSIASRDHSMTSWSPFAPSEEKIDMTEPNAKSNNSIHTPQLKGMDSADVSAELITRPTTNDEEDVETMSNFEGAIGDISLEAGALDSAFQTLTRIQRKDVAATVNAHNRISSLSSISPLLSTTSKTTLTGSPVSPPRRKSTFDHQTRKMSIGGWYTPNESPTQTNDSWMQWGTNKIKATMPRGIASALFAVVGDPDGRDEQGILRKSTTIDEDPNGAEFSDDEGPNEEYGKILVQDCVDVICEESNGLLSLEGIFRISPSKALLRSTKASYLKGQRPELAQLCKRDPHLPAALLKDYLRSLRPPIFPESMYEFISACPSDSKTRITYIRDELLSKLEPNRISLLKETFKCANMVSQHSSENRMDSSNLTVVLTPNLIHGQNILQDIALCSVGKIDQAEEEDGGDSEKKNSGTLGGIVKVCIENYDEIFKQDEQEEGHNQEQKGKDAE